MAKVYMTCGRICSGKSTYAAYLRRKHNAVVLSVDEITLALFGQDTGDKHDEYVERAERYLFEKSVEIINEGINVVLDWGFWQRNEREYARQFYGSRGIPCELHYLSISDEEWCKRIEKRNRDVADEKTQAYYIDKGLAEKFAGLFEAPDEQEADIIIDADKASGGGYHEI